MGQTDSDGVLDQVRDPSLTERCLAAWVLLGCAGAHVRDHVPPALRRDVQDVLWMLDVAAPDVLRHRPRKRRRRRVNVRNRR
jgi:hypothetical protein